MEKSPSLEWVTPPWFLVTPPKPAALIVARPRVHDLLQTSTGQVALTLMGAPSGFGKTSVLSTWISSRHVPVAWLSLTWNSGIDKRRLLGGILGAIQGIKNQLSEGDGKLISQLSPGSLNTDQFLQQLCHVGSNLSAPIVIVIDDAQLADAQDLHRVAVTLSMYSEYKLRLVLSGTDNFSASFADELRDGNAVLIAAEDLAFTEQEIGEQYELGSDAAASVFTKTAGWPIAVHLSSLTATKSVIQLEAGMEHPKFETSQEELLQYVQKAVLRQLPERLREFVLAATACVRLNASLARQLSGFSEAADLLDECVERGLFLERYLGPDSETVFRWYRPVAQLCQMLLHRTDPEQSAKTHRTAAEALLHKHPLEAVDHALRAKDTALATEIIRKSFIRILCESGAPLLNSMCLRLAQLSPPSADLLMIRASALDVVGDLSGATMLEEAARNSQRPAPDDTTQQVVIAYCQLFLSRTAEELVAAVDRAREFLPKFNAAPEARAYQIFCLGWSELRLRRDTVDAVRLLRCALDDAQSLELPALKRLSHSNLKFALAFGGDFVAARKLCENANTGENQGAENSLDAGWKFYDGGIGTFTLAYLDFWQGRQMECAEHLAELFKIGGHSTSYFALGCVYHAMLAALKGDPSGIQQASDMLELVSDVEQHGVPWGMFKTFGRATLKFASGNADEALALLEPLREVESIPVIRVWSAEMFRQAGKLDEALFWLSRLMPKETASYIAAQALVTSAAVAHERGDKSAAHEQLERALNIAAPEGIALPFTPNDDTLRILLTEHAAWGTKHEHILAPRIGQQVGLSRTEMISAQLSSREREVFGYLCTTMTAEEIATTLFVSVNTVRTHQRSIYRKLGVNSRRDAIKLTV